MSGSSPPRASFLLHLLPALPCLPVIMNLGTQTLSDPSSHIIQLAPSCLIPSDTRPPLIRIMNPSLQPSLCMCTLPPPHFPPHFLCHPLPGRLLLLLQLHLHLHLCCICFPPPLLVWEFRTLSTVGFGGTLFSAGGRAANQASRSAQVLYTTQ